MIEEKARRDVRRGLAHALEEFGVEGRHETPVGQAEGVRELRDAAGHRAGLHAVAGLDLDDVPKPAAVAMEHLLQLRDAVLAELRRDRELLDLPPREAAHRDALGPEHDVLVVKEHGFAVARLPHVELDGVDAEALGEVEALDRVFARPPRGAAVADDPDRMRLFPLAHADRPRIMCDGRTPSPRGSGRAPPRGPAPPSTGRPITRRSAPAARAAAGSRHALLVSDVGAGGPDAGHDREELASAGVADRRQIGRRADDAVQPARLREKRQAPRDPFGMARDRQVGERPRIERRQQRHRDQALEAGAVRRLARRLEHRAAAGGVDVDHRRAGPRGGGNGAGDGGRNVVKLQVEEDPGPRRRRDLRDERRALRRRTPPAPPSSSRRGPRAAAPWRAPPPATERRGRYRRDRREKRQLTLPLPPRRRPIRPSDGPARRGPGSTPRGTCSAPRARRRAGPRRRGP